MIAHYGQPGDVSNLVLLPVSAMANVRFDGVPVRNIRCHKLVAESLGRIICDLAKVAPDILTRYAGCFNDRPMRGGTRKSKHAWGVAVDFDPGSNGLRTPWPEVATMPLEVMEVFSRHGWQSAGAFWGRDAMHFEMTRPA